MHKDFLIYPVPKSETFPTYEEFRYYKAILRDRYSFDPFKQAIVYALIYQKKRAISLSTELMAREFNKCEYIKELALGINQEIFQEKVVKEIEAVVKDLQALINPDTNLVIAIKQP